MQALLGIKATNETQVLKQPDVLMLLYMLPDEFDEATMRANWDYYTPRTDLTYGSSLAPGIQAILASRMGRPEMAYHLFMQSALVDLQDLRLNTEHGIHGATAGASVAGCRVWLRWRAPDGSGHHRCTAAPSTLAAAAIQAVRARRAARVRVREYAALLVQHQATSLGMAGRRLVSGGYEPAQRYLPGCAAPVEDERALMTIERCDIPA